MGSHAHDLQSDKKLKKKKVRVKESYSARETSAAFLFLLPSLIGFVAFYFAPALRGFWISLHEWDLLTEKEFIGAENYVNLLGNSEFRNAFWVTFKYVLWNIPFQTTFAVFIAIMMHRLTKSAVIRAIILLPWLMPNVVVGLLWVWLLDPGIGIVNIGIEALGFNGLKWLGGIDTAVPSIALINIWRHMGYTALLIFAGLQTIPESLYEAASIDGANDSQTFWRITVPLLRPVLAFVLVTTVIGSFQIFDTIAVTTEGGPINATEVVNWFIFERGFGRFKMGEATAASMILFSVLIIVSLIQLRVFNADESDF